MGAVGLEWEMGISYRAGRGWRWKLGRGAWEKIKGEWGVSRKGLSFCLFRESLGLQE